MNRFLLLIFLCSLNIVCKAQWTSDTTVNTIVRDTLGATAPMMATRNDGSTYISWFESGSTGYELRMQLLDSSGMELWNPGGIVVSNYPQSSATYLYDLKIDKQGNAIVAFQDMRTNNALHIVVYKVSVSGNLVWGSTGIQLIDPDSEQGLAPVIGIGENNYVYVAWTADSVDRRWITYQSISPAGTIFWNQFYRIKDQVGNLNYSRPKLFSTGGNIEMLYVEESGSFPATTSTMYIQRFDTAATTFFPAPVRVSTKTIPVFFHPEAHPDDNGGFFVAFNTSNPINTALNDVYVQYVDYNGNLWNPEGIEAANSTTEHKTTPSSCYAPMSNEFWVLLQVQDGAQGMSGLTVQRFDGSGSLLLGNNGLNLFPVSSAYYLPYTITDTQDGAIVSCGRGLFGQVHLLAEKIDNAGNVVWPGVVAPLCAVNSNKDDVQAGKFFHNNLVFAWQDDRNGSGVFAQNINGDGQPGITNSVRKISDSKFAFYPNPSKQFTIEFSDATEKQVTITDMNGKNIHTEKISGNRKNYSPEINLSDGIYFISVTSPLSTKTIRWLKN